VVDDEGRKKRGEGEGEVGRKLDVGGRSLKQQQKLQNSFGFVHLMHHLQTF
jgi:hypothetical protein